MMMKHDFVAPTLDTRAIEAKFWAAHAAWRVAEDACEIDSRCGDDPEWQAMCDAASELRDVMFSCGVFSATALLAKLDAVNEGMGGSCLDMNLPGGYRVMDVILWDCGRLACRENGSVNEERHVEADYRNLIGPVEN